MAKHVWILPAVVLLSGWGSAQTLGAIPGRAQPDLQAAFLRSPLACAATERFVVPQAVAERAKVKARLLNLLHDSIYDDSRGVVNIERENEIRKLASKLGKEKSAELRAGP